MRPILFSLIFFFSLSKFYAQNSKEKNIPSFNGVHNTSVHYFHNFIENAKLESEEAFKPYLAYIDADNNIKDDLMDSFILYDFYHQRSPFKDIADLERELDYYLDNLFVKTKLIKIGKTRNNSYGIIPSKSPQGIVSNYIQLTTNTNNSNYFTDYSLNLEIRSDNAPVKNNDPLIIGIEFYDKDFQKIWLFDKGNTNSNIGINGNSWVWSEWLGYHYKKVFWNQVNPTWSNIEHKIQIPLSHNIKKLDDAKYIRVFFNAWQEEEKIYIDNVSFTNNTLSNGVNLIKDSGFDKNRINSPWQNSAIERTISLRNINYLYFDRKPLLDAVNNVKTEINSLLQKQSKVKVFFTFPLLDPSMYDTKIKRDALKILIDDYYNEIERRFNNWNSPEKNIEIAGICYAEESINSIGNANKINNILPVLNHLKNKANDRNWKFVGSPYHMLAYNYHKCETETSYDYEVLKEFDIAWQQPNSWHKTTVTKKDKTKIIVNVDRDVLKTANDLIDKYGLSVNIESRLKEDDENYGRVNDYFSYGYKYGYINKSKCYFDDSGAYYRSCYSNDKKQREDYDNLYKFIKKGKQGWLVNSRFENKSNNNLYKWTGNYGTTNNFHSSSDHTRELEFETTPANPDVQFDYFAVTSDKEYSISFQSKEEFNDYKEYSGAITLQFYDINNNILDKNNPPLKKSNINYSDYYGYWYSYVITKSNDYKYFKISFTPPNKAVKAKIVLKNWMKIAPIKWKSLTLHNNIDIFPVNFVKTKNRNTIDSPSNLGNYSVLLRESQYISPSYKISIMPNEEYILSFDSKFNKPMMSEIDKSIRSVPKIKLKIGFELFNIKGNKITTSYNNLPYDNNLGMHYIYSKDLKQDWNTNINAITFPNEVVAFKPIIKNNSFSYNAYLDNINLRLNGDLTSSDYTNDWGQEFPMVVGKNKPVFYNKLLDVSNANNISFSAFVKENMNNSGWHALIAVEYLDENYNLITGESESNIKLSNLIWSESYKYWGNYINVDSYSCNGSLTWYKNQWKPINLSLGIPKNAKWAKISLHNLVANDNHVKLLNPKIGVNTSGQINPEKQTYIESINKIQSKSIFKIYPNPVHGELSIITESTIDKLLLYNSLGQLIKNSTKRNKLNISNLKNGIYFLKIRNLKGESETKKIIKK